MHYIITIYKGDELMQNTELKDIATKLYNMADKLAIEEQLETIAKELNGDRELDWSDPCQFKFCLAYFVDSQQIFRNYATRLKQQGTIYCLDRSFVDVAKERIGEKALIEYLK